MKRLDNYWQGVVNGMIAMVLLMIACAVLASIIWGES